MNSTDICRIIKACGQAGVQHFICGELNFILGNEPAYIQNQTRIIHDIGESPVKLDNQMEMFNNNKDTEEVIDEEDIDLTEMQLTDPVGFESYMNGDKE